jgi:hypothetical protein
MKDLMEEMQDRGYTPSDRLGSFGEQWFVLGFDAAIVRVVMDDSEGGHWTVRLLTASAVECWSASFRGAPVQVITTAMDAAEDIAEDMEA